MAKKAKAEEKAEVKVEEKVVEEKKATKPTKKAEPKILNECPSPLDYATPTEEYIKLAYGFYRGREPTQDEMSFYKSKLDSEGQPRIILTKLADE
jgi:hypothetical protein